MSEALLTNAVRQNMTATEPESTTPPAVWISALTTPLCKYAHKSSTQATGTYSVHTHGYYEIVYIVSGDVEFMIDMHPFRVGNHTLVAFPPEMRHGVLVDSKRPYERYTLHFDPACLSVERRMLLQEALAPGTGHPRDEACVWKNMETSGVLQCLEAMETLHTANPDTVEMLLPIYVEALLATLYAVRQTRLPSAQPQPRPTTAQQDLVLWVEQHYTEPVTLDSLAERFFLSRGYVNTLFRRATGSTVKAYVQQRRMSYAQMLLSAGLSPAQAATRAGFEDYTTFYRTYLRFFGHAPSAARQTANRNNLLAEALVSHSSAVMFQSDMVSYPEDGTEREDPSMMGAVQIPTWE